MVPEWFVVRDGKELGPFALATLKDRIAKGFLTPDTLVRHIDAKAPVKAGTIKELSAEFGMNPAASTSKPVPPPLPTAAQRTSSAPTPVSPPAGSTPRAAELLSLDDETEPTESVAQDESSASKPASHSRARLAGKVVLLVCLLGAPPVIKVLTDPPTATDDMNKAKEIAQKTDLTQRLVPKPEFREGDVVWSDNALADEARNLAAALRETGYSTGDGKKRVELARTGDSRIVRVYMPSAEIEKPRVQVMMRDYAGVLWGAIAFEGKPLVVKLCEEGRAERFSYPVGPSARHTFGPGCYVYHPTNLSGEAERFGRFVARTAGTDRPGAWLLTRREGKWSVCPGATNDPLTDEKRGAFRQAAKQISDEVFGGQAVELWLFTREGVEGVSAGR